MQSDEIDELLKIAGGPEAHRTLTEIENFLQEYKFQKGEVGHSSADIYHVYQLWSLEPCSYANFFKEFRAYFPPDTVKLSNGSRRGRRTVGYYVSWISPNAAQETDKNVIKT